MLTGALVSRTKPHGTPKIVAIMSRQVEDRSTLRQSPIRIIAAIDVEVNTDKGVAILIPTTNARRGTAIKASPKPNADLIKAAMKRIVTIRIKDETKLLKPFEQLRDFIAERSVYLLPLSEMLSVNNRGSLFNITHNAARNAFRFYRLAYLDRVT